MPESPQDKITVSCLHHYSITIVDLTNILGIAPRLGLKNP